MYVVIYMNRHNSNVKVYTYLNQYPRFICLCSICMLVFVDIVDNN